ncbi:MAG: ATP-binding cassette domain-containing protein [Verrucomicrobia bacterium]|nr:ATP-binding cassette domain-containing protein [Verrucomicrobiota bacterium]
MRGSSTLGGVLELHDVSLLISAKPQELVLVGDVNAVFAPGELVALVGAPGSGKSTLLKLLAGIRRPTFGKLVWTDPNGAPLRARPAVAYLPQELHSASHEQHLLTATEQVQMALRLRVAGMGATSCREQAAALLEKVELGSLADRHPDALNAVERRRLDLATELAGSPALLLCDESAAACDPKTEGEFTHLLRTIASKESLSVVHVTHNLGDLDIYDSVMVLHGGQLAFHGPPDFLTHYFALPSAKELYTQLATRRPDDWHRSWIKHGQPYRPPKEHNLSENREEPAPSAREVKPEQLPRVPGAFSQCSTLLQRRWLLAWRNPPVLGMQLALLFGLPWAAAFFATGDLTRLQEFSQQLKGNVAEQLKENAVFAVNASHGVGLVAGLAMAQALLLAFMASQNAAREISGERMAFEREKQRGLRPLAYVASKVLFLFPWVLVQGAWMGWYVQTVCRLPGQLWMQIAVLTLVNAALTSLCLAVSSLTRTSWRSLPVCLCIAVLQLPLSGAVLSPPETLSWIVRPLGTLYWGASAYLQSMQGTRFYEALQVVTPLTLSPPFLCMLILSSQIVLGLLLTLFGCKIARLGVAWKPYGI